MASPDDARVEEAHDQSTVPTSPPAATDTSPPTSTGTTARDAAPADDEPTSAPLRRPRGAASFPGGPPPAAPAPADTPVAPPPVPEAAPPPQFRVTTVDSTAASFAGGPPPPAPPPRDDPPPVTTARAGAPAEPAPSPDAPAPSTRREARTEPSGGQAGVADSTEATPAGEAAATRTGGRRRRRGGRGRGPADPAAPAETAGTDPADAAGGPDPAPAAGPTGLGGPAVRDLAPEPTADGATPAEPGTTQDEATTVGGSARTRARRRRRAAAKARGRDGSADTAEPAGSGDAGEPTTPSMPAAAPADETSPRAARARGPAEEPATRTTRSRGGAPGEETSAGAARSRGAAAGDAAAQAAPAGSPQDERAGEAPAPTRPSRRRRGGSGNGEARPANGDQAQPADGDPQAGTATRAPGERGPGRSRRRGRGGARLAAVDTDADAATATATPDAPPEGEAREQGDGRGRSGGSERSTRLETRSKREGARQADRGRRRRPSGLTEEQKRILREEGPDRRMVVTEGAERTQIGVLEGQTLVEHYVTRKAGRSMVGNIYLGRVQNVLPGMEAAFVDIGRGRNAVLYAGEVNYNEEDLDGEAPRIERVLKAGQPVLVQVTKDPIGAKGARLTAQVSLAGRYLVLQPEDNTFGISRRLPETERSRLRDILKEVRPKGLGLIVRTAAEGASADDLRADLARLQARWETVERKAKKSSAPAVIYSEPELVVRVIRDIFSPDFVELVVDDDDLYQRVQEYLAEVAPDLLPKLHKHQGKLPVFEHYRVVEQIHKALERKVWLPSGGSIVIDRTEAMTVIDVNTGKFVGKANLEETVVANNLEAADEIVRQLRLRDIGGIIIIDFIDMLFERNQQAVVDRLRAALVRDKTKSQVMEVSSLGLVQMTRKRVSGGLLDSFSETCPTCDGRGVVITHEI
jgi:ribonuclease E